MLAKGFIKNEEDLETDISGFDFYFSAFRDLSSCRQSGMALTQIPFTAIIEYAKIYDVGDFDDFKELIQRMDLTFLEINEEKSKAGEKDGSSRSNDKGSKTNR